MMFGVKNYIKSGRVRNIMAKTIKFNLICDRKPVRTIEDLRENFSIEDMLAYYNNKLLQRWLDVRGSNKELALVEALDTKDVLELVKSLIKIFEIETDKKVIEENIYILAYRNEAKVLLDSYNKNNYQKQEIIDDYYTGYRELVMTIIEHKSDIVKIKAALKEIDQHYKYLFELNYRELFFTFCEKAPMALFAMLMRECMRKKYLPIFRKTENGEIVSDLELNNDKKNMFNKLITLTSSQNLKQILGDTLKSFSGITDGYWKDVEDMGKQYMILRMENGNYVRDTGVKDGDMDSNGVNNKFPIISGIDYKSNSSSDQLLYMEV